MIVRCAQVRLQSFSDGCGALRVAVESRVGTGEHQFGNPLVDGCGCSPRDGLSCRGIITPCQHNSVRVSRGAIHVRRSDGWCGRHRGIVFLCRKTCLEVQGEEQLREACQEDSGSAALKSKNVHSGTSPKTRTECELKFAFLIDTTAKATKAIRGVFGWIVASSWIT